MATNVYDSFNKFFSQQSKNFKDASIPAKVLREAAIFTAGAVKDRVQQEGLMSSGRSMDAYSTKPFARPRGLRGKGKWKKYPEGYRQFRQSHGRQVSFRDLTLSGDMFRTWRPIPVDQLSYGVSFVNADMRRRADFQEADQMGDIFAPTRAERTDALRTINKNARIYLSR
jgi:hypothetical protein